jgi:hypothetical protein
MSFEDKRQKQNSTVVYDIAQHRMFYLPLVGFLRVNEKILSNAAPGNTEGGSITVPLTSCLTSLDLSVLQMKTKKFRSHTAVPKPVKQEVNSTMILPPLVFPGCSHGWLAKEYLESPLLYPNYTNFSFPC